MYDSVFNYLYQFANYKMDGVPFCHILAFVVFIGLLFIARLISSVLLKFFSIMIAMLIYFFPQIINVFM
jgi:hypothetical protein